jgi:hypothetical protein
MCWELSVANTHTQKVNLLYRHMNANCASSDLSLTSHLPTEDNQVEIPSTNVVSDNTPDNVFVQRYERVGLMWTLVGVMETGVPM